MQDNPIYIVLLRLFPSIETIPTFGQINGVSIQSHGVEYTIKFVDSYSIECKEYMGKKTYKLSKDDHFNMLAAVALPGSKITMLKYGSNQDLIRKTRTEMINHLLSMDNHAVRMVVVGEFPARYAVTLKMSPRNTPLLHYTPLEIEHTLTKSDRTTFREAQSNVELHVCRSYSQHKYLVI